VWRLLGQFAPPAGHLDLGSTLLRRRPGDERRYWSGRLWHDGMLVLIRSSSRGAVLAAARALEPTR
jgi:hypothetical protein